jgi:protein-arginine kinase activator protein McsA
MTYNVICQRCGFEYKNFQVRKEPRTELIVCEPCYDPAHPQDFVKAKTDLQQVPYVRPDNTTVSVEVDINETTQTDVPSGTFNSNNNTL